jgi:parallel beta-helix repeat protein
VRLLASHPIKIAVAVIALALAGLASLPAQAHSHKSDDTKTSSQKLARGQNRDADVQPPHVVIDTPQSGQEVTGVLTASGSATDDGRITVLEWRLDAEPWQPLHLRGSNWWTSIDTTHFEAGRRSFSVRAVDGAGNEAQTSTDFVVQTAATATAPAESEPTPEPSPTPSPAPPPPADMTCEGVGVAVGQSIQDLVNLHPAGTTFCLDDGVHRRQSVRPKMGNAFVGPATLDGEGDTSIAFHPTADNVTIRGLVLENYANPAQVGVIHAGGHTAADGTFGWVVEGNTVRHNAGTGIRIGHRMVVRGNHVHHNAQLGIGGVGNSTLVEGNEIAWNNYRGQYSPGWEAGGTKFVRTHDLVVRGNHSHHNTGPGLWTDGSNIRTLYEDNLVEDNTQEGIFHEISYDAVIRNNTVRRNGHGRMAWMYGAGILIAHSSNVTVYGNTLVDNWNGITGIDQNRGSGDYGPFELRDLHVHDNSVTWTVEVPKDSSGHGGVSGVAQDFGDITYFDTRNILFERNTYTVPDPTRGYWAWPNSRRTFTGWTGLGQDREGTVSRS